MAVGKHRGNTKSHNQDKEAIRLGAGDVRQLLEICVGVLEFTSRVTRKLDPSYSTLVKLAQDEIELADCYGARATRANPLPLTVT
jgi:hypothetical protein